MRLSFVQIHRLFEAFSQADEDELKKFRIIAYEVWRKGSKHSHGIESYMPIGKKENKSMTDEELDEVWEKYGTLKKGVKMRRITRLMRN